MKVVILCGGRGFRLNEETEFRPKPLVNLGNKPILWHIMKIYSKFGFNQFVLCLGYRGDMIKEYFLNYNVMNCDSTIILGRKQEVIINDKHDADGMLVTLADTGLETQTSERLKRVQKYIGDETFMLTYGDGVADIDIKNLLEFHKSHGKVATVTTVHPISKYGVIKSEDGLVTQFSEKPVENDRISAGFFVFEPKVFDYLDDGMLEQTPLKKLTQYGQLMEYRHGGFFFSMDTYRDYIYLNEMWNKGEAKWI
jgi:glucose-1-phosphate cytidylyltransferase